MVRQPTHLRTQMCRSHTCHLLAQNTRDAPEGWQSVLSVFCPGRTSWSEPLLSVCLTLSVSQEEHNDGHATWYHRPDPPGRRQRCKHEHGDNGTRRCCECGLTLQTPRATENQRLEARICCIQGAGHRVTKGKQGGDNTCFYSSGDSEAERALT